jgi:hypothetical protein
MILYTSTPYTQQLYIGGGGLEDKTKSKTKTKTKTERRCSVLRFFFKKAFFFFLSSCRRLSIEGSAPSLSPPISL